MPPRTGEERAKAFPVVTVIRPEGDSVSTVAPADPRGEGNEKPDYSWRRKAVKRRLQRCRITGPGEDYAPQFTVPRPQDSAPVFELTSGELAGRVIHVSCEMARNRESMAVWAACLFAALLTTMACATVLRSGGDDQRTASVTTPEIKTEARIWAEVKRNTSRVPEARAAAEAFFRAHTPGEKVHLVRGGEAMLPALRRHYARHPDELDGFSLAQNIDFGSDGDREFIFVHGTDALGGAVETLVEDTPSGMKLDWRFLTGAGDMEWEEWIAERPCRPVSMRVEAQLDDYYAGPFSDAGKWLCLKITGALRTSAVWAYVPRVGDDGFTIYRQLNGRTRPVRMLGDFEFPATNAPASKTAPQVHLRSAAAQGWLDCTPEATGSPARLNSNLPLPSQKNNP